MSSGSDSAQNHLTAADLGTLIMRGFAVLAVFRALQMLLVHMVSDLFMLMSPITSGQTHQAYISAYMWVQAIGFAAIAFIFWQLAPRTGALLAKGIENRSISNISYEQVTGVIFIALGCLLLLESLTHTAAFLSDYARHLSELETGVSKNFHPDWGVLLNAAFFFVLSLVFILKAGGISRAVTFLRSAGKDKSG